MRSKAEYYRDQARDSAQIARLMSSENARRQFEERSQVLFDMAERVEKAERQDVPTSRTANPKKSSQGKSSKGH